MAMSILPINKSPSGEPANTLVYGSADAGKTIHASNEDVNKKVCLCTL